MEEHLANPVGVTSESGNNISPSLEKHPVFKFVLEITFEMTSPYKTNNSP